MPPKKDTTKSSSIEPSEDETSYRTQLETLQLQLEEAQAVTREAQERLLTAKEDRERIFERAREYEATAEEEREKVRELRQKLSQNYKHLERCTCDNARLSGIAQECPLKQIVEKSENSGLVHSDLYIIRISRQSVLGGISVYLPKCIGEAKTKFLIDTGAEVTIMSQKLRESQRT